MQKSNTKPRQVSQACFGKSILLIDTDEVNHELHQAFLKKFKCQLTYSKSLIHALWLVQEKPPDLILTEIYFNGYLHYDHLFALRREHLMPIIIQSTQNPLIHEVNCKIRGAEAYFQKPLNWQKYLKSIESCLTVPYDFALGMETIGH